VSERLIELVSKTSVRFTAYRGFESRPLRFWHYCPKQSNQIYRGNDNAKVKKSRISVHRTANGNFNHSDNVDD
jgi:hypothetical protein